MPVTSGTSSGIQLPQLQGRLVHWSLNLARVNRFSSQIKLLATSKGSLQTRTDNLKKFEQSRRKKKAEVDKLSAHWRTVSHQNAAFGRAAVLSNPASSAGDDASAVRYTPQEICSG